VNQFIKTKKLVLREPNLKDSEKVANLYKINFPEHILVKRGILSNPEKMKEEFQKENKRWLIAELDKKIVGCSAVEFSEWNSAAEIERVVVAKNMRNNGIAKKMCKALIDKIAKPEGVKYVFAHARGPQYGMQKVLKDLDFKAVGIMPVFYVNHEGREIRENFVYMCRFLNGGENEIESEDNLIPEAKSIKDIIEKQYNN